MENDEKTGSGTGLAIFSLVIGIIALLFSFIPCIGAFAIYVAPISLLISIVAFFIQNSNNKPTGLAIGAILISLLASSIAFYQAYQIHHVGQELNQFSNDMEKDRQVVLNNSSSQSQNQTQVATQPNTVSESNAPPDNTNKADASAAINVVPQAPMSDIDGNNYPTVQIGTQIWMMENLKTSHFRDGSVIPEIEDKFAWRNILATNAQSPAWCCYDRDVSMNSTYGKLYNWYAVTNSHQLCPVGWHVPTKSDWIVLSNYLGGDETSANHLRGQILWPNGNNDNSSGFNALPSGCRDGNGVFDYFGRAAYFWSSTPDENTGAWSVILGFKLIQNDDSKEHAFSVRLIKD